MMISWTSLFKDSFYILLLWGWAQTPRILLPRLAFAHLIGKTGGGGRGERRTKEERRREKRQEVKGIEFLSALFAPPTEFRPSRHHQPTEYKKSGNRIINPSSGRTDRRTDTKAGHSIKGNGADQGNSVIIHFR